jgi:phage terminase large subunit-like protein
MNPHINALHAFCTVLSAVFKWAREHETARRISTVAVADIGVRTMNQMLHDAGLPLPSAEIQHELRLCLHGCAENTRK